MLVRSVELLERILGLVRDGIIGGWDVYFAPGGRIFRCRVLRLCYRREQNHLLRVAW
jgi:hypothetical protein